MIFPIAVNFIFHLKRGKAINRVLAVVLIIQLLCRNLFMKKTFLNEFEKDDMNGQYHPKGYSNTVRL